ncbi:MAG: hypothetical protein LLF80_07760, partial [Porphyromonadaceae bacterium]|nr:hypothetical protein [Porphyromonadaceae bacterium]
STSLIASIATWALKAALCFFLLVDIMSKFNRFLLNLPCGLNYWEYYRKIFELHFKDLNLKDVKEAHDVVWGTGVSDIKSLIKEMKRQKFEGAITVEYEYNWENSYEEINKSLKNFISYANESNY